MKIKLYIVTYKNPKDLNANLDSLFSSDLLTAQLEVIIINNHSEFQIKPEHAHRVLVLNNALRPDFSTGHLSRNWNQALLHGFVDLKNPQSDIVIHCQDDTVFHKDWLSKILDLHKTYSFIAVGEGDNFCSYLPEAVIKIGLWDERFCNIGFQEADYFMRALMYNKEKSSINDRYHSRLLNPIPEMESIIYRPFKNDYDDHKKSMKFHNTSAMVFIEKFGALPPEHWTQELIDNPPKNTNCKNFVSYPYFEKDIENLIAKNYVFSYNEEYDYKSLFKIDDVLKNRFEGLK